MNHKLFRYFPVYRFSLQLQYKCILNLQNSYCLPPKSLVSNVRGQSSTSIVQPSKEKKKNAEMVKFTFVTHKGEDIETEAECGRNIMAVGAISDVFSGSCNGSLECTICHVYVEDKIADVFKKKSQSEEDKLDTTKCLKPNSRLSCELYVSKKIEGARFQLPPPTKYIEPSENSSEY